jgi:hypothetical protein
MGIGMSSTELSSKSKPPLKDRWATSLGKMHVLGRVIGMESIRRGLAFEDDLARRDAEAYHKALHGERAGTPSEMETMGDIILGDRVEPHYHVTPPPPASSGFGKALIGAGLLATGIGAPLGAYFVADALRGQANPPAVVRPIEPEAQTERPEEQPPIVITEPGKTFDWRVGEPSVERVGEPSVE